MARDKWQNEDWERATGDFYVDPPWCSERLFEVEKFHGTIVDPCCGTGTIVKAAQRAGLKAIGRDISIRKSDDFFAECFSVDNLVFNPPFDVLEEFILHAVELAHCKVAALCPVARLNAAGRWLINTPLQRVWLLTPRPSMPPKSHIDAGGKIAGGKTDYCWLTFEHGFKGSVEIAWLHRDGAIKDAL
jgi:hypothetical protein